MPYWEVLETSSGLCQAEDPLYWPMQASELLAEVTGSDYQVCRHNFWFDQKSHLISSVGHSESCRGQ